MKTFLAIAAACACALPASAQSFQQAQQAAKQNFTDASNEYAQLMQQIDQEKLPMARQMNELQSKVVNLRAEYAEQRRLTEGSETSLINLQSQVTSNEDNVNYITNLLADYITRFDSMIHLGEKPLYNKQIAQAASVRENNDIGPDQRFAQQLQVIEIALNRLQKVIGGERFESTALTEDGQQVEGTYVLIGPASYFAPKGDEKAGITISAANAIEPRIGTKLPGEDASQKIRDLAKTGSATVLCGPAQAYTVAISDDTLVQEFNKGGMVMWPILILSVAALLVAIWKWIELGRVRAARQRDLEVILDHLSNGEDEKAMQHAQSVSGPAGEMLMTAVEHAWEDREVLEEVLYERIISTQPRLERMLPFIAVVAATAPLLGLLGTVTGMIKTFKLITIVGTGDAHSLSSGISEALITTKWGLISAIPALILHAMLSRKARGVVGSMEQTAVGFINGVMEIRENREQSA